MDTAHLVWPASMVSPARSRHLAPLVQNRPDIDRKHHRRLDKPAQLSVFRQKHSAPRQHSLHLILPKRTELHLGKGEGRLLPAAGEQNPHAGQSAKLPYLLHEKPRIARGLIQPVQEKKKLWPLSEPRMDGRGQKPHKLMAGRLHGICAGLKPQAFQKTVLDIGGVLLLTAIEGNVHRSGLHAGIFRPLQIRRPQQGGCLSRSSASQEKNGCSLWSQHVLQKLLQGHSPAVSSLPHNRIESLFLPYIGQSRIRPHRAKHCRPACLPQRPVGDALSLNPVLELLQIQPHLLRALIAASGQRGKSLFQNFLHHAPHSLRHVRQAGGLGDVRRCAAKHLHGRQVLPCKTAVKYSSHGIQVTGPANLTCFSRPNLRRRIPLLGAVVHRPAETYLLQSMNAVVINQGNALPPALSD